MEQVMIQVRNVDRCFPVPDGADFYALRNINMDIPKGKLTIFRGRSGSGKTTLMNLLGLLDHPSKGKIFLNNKELTGMEEEACGYALRLSNYSGDRAARVTECLKMVGLGGRMHHMPQELSGGEQQRVAIARAIAHKPAIIFADEPTAELDTATGLQVVKTFQELVENEAVTVIMTTHDIGFMEVGDRVYELKDGEIIHGS